MDSALARLMGAVVPPKTDSYTPISHNQIIQNTLSAIKSKGFELKSSIYRASADGMLAQGEYHIQYGSDKEMGLMIAWQNSYNKQISFKYAIGAHVIVCSNGVVAGDLGAFRRKHTGDADEQAVKTIENYLTNAGKIFENLIEDREKLKTIKLSPREVAELVGRMYVEDQIITSTQVNIIKREIHNPTFDYGATGTAWELYNHATLSFKEDSPRNWISRHIDLHNFFNLTFELRAKEREDIIMDIMEQPQQLELYEEVPDIITVNVPTVELLINHGTDVHELFESEIGNTEPDTKEKDNENIEDWF